MNNAQIIIYGENDAVKDIIDVQYNPAEYSLDWSVKYALPKYKAGQKNDPEYIDEESGRLNFKLTIDGFTKTNADDEKDAADVSDDVKRLKTLVQMEGNLHKPPECMFKWGTLEFRGVMDKLSVRYTMFSSAGKPIRAAVDISIVQTKTRPSPRNSPDRTQRRILTQDTELYMMAHEAYGDPSEWRSIALANGIKNPRLLETGSALRVPPLEDNR